MTMMMGKSPDLAIQIISDDTGKIRDFVTFLENVGVQWQNARGYYPTKRLEGKIAYFVEYVSLPDCDTDPKPGPYDAVLGGKS